MPNLGEDSPVVFHLDYLKLTVFQEIDQVLGLVESSLLERAGLELGGWIERGPVGRFEHLLISPRGVVSLLSPKQAMQSYTIIELKGVGCEACGAIALAGFLSHLGALEVRWHCLRVDLAFDHVRFTPHQINEAVRAGNFNSRGLNISDRDWRDSETGQTAYLGGRSESKVRRLRVYNKHGFVRCEAELRGDWAKSCARQLSEVRPEKWPEIAIGHLRGTVDFIDRSADARVDRCPLLPWWADLVGDVERIRNLPEEDRKKVATDATQYAIGLSETRIMRNARTLLPILRAFGGRYFCDRIEHYGKDRLTQDDGRLIEELKRFRFSGLAGLPYDETDGDDIPF